VVVAIRLRVVVVAIRLRAAAIRLRVVVAIRLRAVVAILRQAVVAIRLRVVVAILRKAAGAAARAGNSYRLCTKRLVGNGGPLSIFGRVMLGACANEASSSRSAC